MNEPKSFRHELKYNITDAQLALIRSRIDHLLPPDSHTGDTGAYTIRSLYFDDYDNRCFLENEDGIDPREKIPHPDLQPLPGPDHPGVQAQGAGHDPKDRLPADPGADPAADGRAAHTRHRQPAAAA